MKTLLLQAGMGMALIAILLVMNTRIANQNNEITSLKDQLQSQEQQLVELNTLSNNLQTAVQTRDQTLSIFRRHDLTDLSS